MQRIREPGDPSAIQLLHLKLREHHGRGAKDLEENQEIHCEILSPRNDRDVSPMISQ